MLFLDRGSTPGHGPAILVIRPLSDIAWPWLSNPQSWLGVHKIVGWLLSSALTITLFILGVASLWAAVGLASLKVMNPKTQPTSPAASEA